MNCLIVDDDEFSRILVKDFVQRTPNLVLEGECENALDAYDFLKTHDIDIVFLDVEMPKMSGIDLIRAMDGNPQVGMFQVIMITSREFYAVQAFEYSVTDYLVKPISYDRFKKALAKVEGNLNSPVLPSFDNTDIFVKSDSKIVKIKLADILYIEALSDYVIINTNQKRHIVHSTMKSLEKRLHEKYQRVHRSFIVNMDKIDTIEDFNIIMPGKTIPIGASYKNQFLKKLNFL